MEPLVNPAQKLARRARRRERQIVAAFLQIADVAGMTPAQVATSAVVVYADVRTKPARVWAYNLNPAPELRTQGPRVTFACDRARLLEVWQRPESADDSAEGATLTTMLQSAPQEGFFWLLCIAGAPGERSFSWSLSMVAWSVYGAAVQNGDISREEALAVSRKIEAECPECWNHVPRETGAPMTDDERVEYLRAAWQYARETKACAN